jgi:hypothetical protein
MDFEVVFLLNGKEVAYPLSAEAPVDFQADVARRRTVWSGSC